MWRTLCCIDLICYNGSVWACMGCCSSKRFGAHHSCTVWLLAWLAVLPARLAGTKAGDWPPLTVLETVALFPRKSSFHGRAVLQTMQELCGQTQLVVWRWLCLFALWSWLAQPLLAPGSPLLQRFLGLTHVVTGARQKAKPRVRQVNLLAPQPSRWSWPKRVGGDLCVVTGHLGGLYPALRPLRPVVVFHWWWKSRFTVTRFDFMLGSKYGALHKLWLFSTSEAWFQSRIFLTLHNEH